MSYIGEKAPLVPEKYKDHGTVASGTITPDLEDGYVHYINGTGDFTLANPINTPAVDKPVTLKIIIDGAFLNSITLGTAYDIPSFTEEGFGRTRNTIIHTIIDSHTSTALERDGTGEYISFGIPMSPYVGEQGDLYGRGIALSAGGTILAVGTPGLGDGVEDQTGTVFVHTRSSSSWRDPNNRVNAADKADTDYFGSAVALSADGTILAVGAEGRAGSGAEVDAGGVYIYDYSGGTWTQRGSVLEASDQATNDWYGTAVALSADGEVLAVGANGWEGAISEQGGVYIYDRNGTGWDQRGSVLVAGDATATDRFSSAVSFSADGEVLIVGAKYWDDTGTNTGGVYIYDRNGTSWTQRGSVLEANDPVDNEYFGSAVALSANGEILVVATSFADLGLVEAGVAYIYDKSGTSWVERGRVVSSGKPPEVSSRFGSSVAISEDASLLVVGAENDKFASSFTPKAIGLVHTFLEVK